MDRMMVRVSMYKEPRYQTVWKRQSNWTLVIVKVLMQDGRDDHEGDV